MPNDKEVHITGSGRTLSVPDADISKKNGQQIKWVSDIDQAATLTFADSPFKKGTQRFTVPAHGKENSGSVDKDARAGGKPYKYSVTAANFDPLDPNVIVND